MSEDGESSDAVPAVAKSEAEHASEQQTHTSNPVQEETPPREKMIETSIKFLQNPQVRKSPLVQKKAFLQKKGLTTEEIEIAIDRSGTREDLPSTPAQSTPQGTQGVSQPPGAMPYTQQMVPYQAHPPVVRSKFETWRDYATLAIIISGVSYGFYKLYEKFLQPLLRHRQEEKERQERLEESIHELSASVREAVTEMQKSLTSINTLLENQQGKVDQLTLDLSTNRSVMATNRSSDSSDLKAEITSLKGLLLNRHQFPSTPQPTPIPEWQRSSANQETTPTKLTNQQTDTAANPPITDTQKGDPTQNAISNGLDPVNHDDKLVNQSMDNDDVEILSSSDGKTESDRNLDTIDKNISHNGVIISENGEACV